MEKYFKRFHVVMINSALFLNLFFAIHYFFRNDPISSIIIPIYFLFFIFICFPFFISKKLKIDGRLHVFWILASALLFSYIFQAYQVNLVINDYLYIITSILLISIFVSLTRFEKLSKKAHFISIFLYLILFIGVFLLARYLINQPYMWLFVLLMFKYIPYVGAYHVSKAYSLSFEKIFFLIIFLPFLIVLNTYTRITGT